MRRIAPLAFLLFWLTSPASATVFNPTSFTLANGLQVVVVPNPLAPVVCQMVWYKVGSSDEKQHKTGLAHYLEHLMFRGTDTIPPDQFSRIIAAHGGNDNAFTAYDYTAFFEMTSVENLPMIMAMEADRMAHLKIMSETATPELSVVLDERQQRTDNNPEGRFSEKLRHLAMPHYAYGTPVIGWKKEIENLSTDDAINFYNQHYAPNNAVVIISGDVTADAVMRLAASIYGPLAKRDVAERVLLGEAPIPQQTSYTMVDAGVEQAQITWLATVPSYTTQKNQEAYAYEVLAEVLDGGEVGLLYKKLVVEQGLASGVDTSYDPDARGDTQFGIALTPHTGKDPKALAKALQAALASFAEKGVEEKAVDEAKTRLERSAIFARDSLMMPGYAFGMALTTGHAVTDVEEWPDRIGAVSTDDVNRALRALAQNKKTVTGFLLPDRRASEAARQAAHPVISHDMSIR